MCISITISIASDFYICLRKIIYFYLYTPKCNKKMDCLKNIVKALRVMCHWSFCNKLFSKMCVLNLKSKIFYYYFWYSRLLCFRFCKSIKTFAFFYKNATWVFFRSKAEIKIPTSKNIIIIIIFARKYLYTVKIATIFKLILQYLPHNKTM